jgi:hypothetical protein
MAQATLLSTASTHNIFRGDGTYYGMTVTPAAGGTVVLMDIADAGATAVNINSPAAALNPFVYFGQFPSSPPPASITGYGVRIANGLTCSFTSSMKVTVYYDD